MASRRIIFVLLVAASLLLLALHFSSNVSTQNLQTQPSRFLRAQSSLDRPRIVRQADLPRQTIDEDVMVERRMQQQDLNTTTATEEETELAVTVSFREIYRTIIFIACAWLLGTLCSKVGLPSLVGEICCGFLLGPPLADFVPFPEAMVLMGNIGLIGLMLESGINIDVAQLKESGKRAVIMAFIGSTLPLLVGLGLGLWSGENMKSSISIGASFSPSSFGVVAGALTSGDVINTPIGQMIVAGSVVDDVLGLVLLAIVEVFTYPSPRVIDFIIPFISSFGYLIVLGYSAVTWMPRVIEKHILTRFSEKYREFVAFTMMFFLLIAYMPLLHYSRASSLTGSFLAGLTFSTIYSIHRIFVNKGRHLLNWLLRIFFSATIGFQVPVTSFGDPYVLKWGAKFILAILVKMPLGFCVPHYQREIPDDFPYNPYWRDFWIASLSVTCRGEFNFIIASFALSVGLINSKLYAAIVFAVLVACVIGPLVLSRVIQHYNKLSKDYLTGEHPIHRIGTTNDGYRPLFLSIQARTPVEWGLQHTFKKALENAGLIIIDHRSFHTLGMNAVDITELFVQDTKVKVRVQQCFADIKSAKTSFRSVEAAIDAAKEKVKESKTADEETVSGYVMSTNVGDFEEIEERCNEIREVLVQSLSSKDPSTFTIKVSQWKPFTPDEEDQTGETVKGDAKSYCLLHTQDADDGSSAKLNESVSTTNGPEASIDSLVPQDVPAEVTLHRRKMTEPDLDHDDLWDTDSVAKEACKSGHFMVPASSGHFDITGGSEAEVVGSPVQRHRRRVTIATPFDVDTTDDSGDNIKERLHGYVRAESFASSGKFR